MPVPERPSTAVSGSDGVRVALVGPQRIVVAAPSGARARVAMRLEAAVPPGAAVVVADVTGAVTTFQVKGAGVADVLAQGFALDFASLVLGSDGIVSTEGWGVAAILENRDGSVFVTVDTSFGDYVEHMLRTAAGLATSAKPGVMQSPPPPIRVAG